MTRPTIALILAAATMGSAALTSIPAEAASPAACLRAERLARAQVERRNRRCVRRGAEAAARGEIVDFSACDGEEARMAARLAARGCEPARGALLEGDVVVERPESPDLIRPQSATREKATWPGNVVPYVIDTVVSSTMRQRIATAIDHWNKTTLVRLKLRTSEGTWVRFTNTAWGCYSDAIGRLGWPQTIGLASSCQVGHIIHEIGHAVGLWHEQQRQDRDLHIQVHEENITSGLEPQFAKYPWSLGFDRGPFDFGSIMLYGSSTGSNGAGPTMTRLDGSTFEPQLVSLSKGDVAGLTWMITRPGASLIRFRNDATGRCILSPPGVGAMVQTTCSSASRFYWYLSPVTSQRHIVRDQTGQCLYPPSSSSGTGIYEMSCGNRDWQWFQKVASGTRTLIKSLRTGLCLEASTTSLAIRQSPCSSSGASTQGWTELAG